MSMPLEWTHLTAEITGRGLSETRQATPDELVELARALDIPAVKSLAVTYEIRPLAAGRFRVTGEIKADVVQACIVTLEPIPAEVSEEFSIELWPAEELSVEPSEGEQEILSAPDVEPIADGRIEAGNLVYELIASSLEPYPRKEGAEFGWVDPKAEEPSAASPFAVLSRLKNEG